MFVRFYAKPIANRSSFDALFTAYRENTSPDCAEDEFNCEDTTCISQTLRCNGQDNCRYKWDEDECGTQQKVFDQNHIIIIMVIFSLILSGMCFTFVFNCVKKLIRDHHTMQEYIRESREQQLNELGKQHQEQFEPKKISAGGKLSRSRSNSTSSDSQRFATANAMPNTPCYVPGGELLPIMIRNEHHHAGSIGANGDTYNPTVVHPYDTESTPQPEMCDSACQTRESLFHPYGSEHSTPIHSIHSSTNSKPSPPAPFSTFGYKKENKFRAEAKIEVEKLEPTPPKSKYDDKRRPYSVQTTKSAPDVIVTH
ncbi:Low-density lipoprotein receptor domain class A [Popillia japonica]|uniref:Low-density lipoprotein receptor domain class A n=1 Tax=Popillia japonica TaxID=7064 RepID=A0AAW1N3J1_POPJA